MTIDSETRRDLRRIAHHLKPVVIVAERGLEDGVLNEIERALSDHELIKVRLAIADRAVRAATAAEISSFTGADKVADIGKITVLFRPNPSAKPQLSNLQRPVSAGKATAKRSPTPRSATGSTGRGLAGAATSRRTVRRKPSQDR